MRVENGETKAPLNIMQAFQKANDMVAESNNIEDMIAAYDQVISFCSNTASCRNEKSTKRDTLLYWAYQNIANAYSYKKMPEAAYLYFEKALATAETDRQKSMVLEKMLDVVGKENLQVADKCRKILSLTNQLTNIYSKNPDNSNLRRIRTLAEKTLELLKKSGN